MLINGKADEITREDFMQTAKKIGIKKAEAEKCIEQAENAISRRSSRSFYEKY